MNDTPGLPPLDMRDAEFRENPYPRLAQLREQEPVHRDAFGVWIVTRYADVAALNKDPRLGRDLRKWIGYPLLRPYLADSALERTAERWMFSLDPPEHTRLRRLASRAFSPSTISGMRGTIERVADALLDDIDALPAGEPFDFIATFARPFPLRVIRGILSLPDEDAERVSAWCTAIAVVVEPTARRAAKQRADECVIELTEFLRKHVNARRGARKDDFLGELIAAEEDGQRLNEDELLANLILIFIAGHETTTNLLGNGLLALLRHPAEIERLRSDPALMSRAVEELLRYDGPANTNGRVAHQDIVVNGTTIEAGQLLLCMLGAANRDPAAFAQPDTLDVGRDPNPHVSFGGGVHFCLGAGLARLETEIALTKMLERWPAVTLMETAPPWRDTVNIRGLERLTIARR